MFACKDRRRFVDRHACSGGDVDAVPIQNRPPARIAPAADEEAHAVEVDPALVHAAIIGR
jgi:hypothetical protein